MSGEATTAERIKARLDRHTVPSNRVALLAGDVAREPVEKLGTWPVPDPDAPSVVIEWELRGDEVVTRSGHVVARPQEPAIVTRTVEVPEEHEERLLEAGALTLRQPWEAYVARGLFRADDGRLLFRETVKLSHRILGDDLDVKQTRFLPMGRNWNPPAYKVVMTNRVDGRMIEVEARP